MKKVSVTILVLIFALSFSDSFSQLPNQNTYLLKNLNQHFTNSLYSGVWGYKSPDGREYAILGCPTGTAYIDITDSANIHEVDFLTGLTSSWREMKTYSHYAYIVSEATNSKLQIVDLQYLPDSVILVNTWNYAGYTRTHSISQSGHYIYLNGGNSNSIGGITVLDVIDPVNPIKLGQWTTLYVHDCRVVNDTIYAANINDGKVSIINASNKISLSTVTSFENLPGSGPHNTALSENGKRLFVTDEIGTAPYLLKIWNIENRSNPVFVTSWQPYGITSSIIHNIEVYGNFAVIAHYSAGIRIVDITYTDAPQEIAWYDTYPSNNNENYNGCWGVYMFPSGKIIASDRQTGLYVIKTSFNELPPLNLSLKMLMEGMYYPVFNQMTRKDTVTVYLRNTTSPYTLVDSAKGVIDSLNFSGLFIFRNVTSGTYFITVKHINSIETWSKSGGETLLNNNSVYTYDFTTSASKAYGNNLKLKGGKYCIYGGNVNGDEIIDGGDLSEVDNDSFTGLSGRYLRSDVNGDNIVDAADVSLVDNNSYNTIVRITP